MNSNTTVSKYLENLAIHGQFYFTLDELVSKLNFKKSSISNSLSRLARANKVLMIRKGFGIYIGHTSGVLDPSYFLDGMMKFMNARYYVGLLNAAAYKGASHQAVMSYTIVVDKVMKPIQMDKLIINFITKNHFDEICEIEKASGIGGYYNLSSPELTMIDLVCFPRKSGGLSNIATVLNDLIESVSLEKFKKIISKSVTPTAILQRLGYLLDIVLKEKKLSKAIELELQRRRVQKISLSIMKTKGDKKLEHCEKWGILINTHVEPDE